MPHETSDITVEQARTMVTPAQVAKYKAALEAIPWTDKAGGLAASKDGITPDQFRAIQVLLWGFEAGNGNKLEMHGRADELQALFGRVPTAWEYQNQIRGGGPLPAPSKPKPGTPPVTPPAPTKPPVVPPAPPQPAKPELPTDRATDLENLLAIPIGGTMGPGRRNALKRVADYLRSLHA